MSDVAYSEYLWIVVLGCLFAFGYAFLIGANDVANAFASSVAAKSLTLTQAVIAAGIFEFCGALFLGAAVTSTIRSKIVDTDVYAAEPDVLMFGMFCSQMAAASQLFIATHLGFPVSTTHDIIGAIMGFSIAAKGWDSIQWDVATSLFKSWILSPLIAGTLGFIFFAFCRYAILESAHPLSRAFYLFPVVLTVGIGIDLFYTLFKVAGNKDFASELTPQKGAGIAFGSAAGCGLIWIFLLGPIAMKRIEAARVAREAAAEAAAEKVVDVEAKVLEANDDIQREEEEVAPEPEEYGAEVEKAAPTASPVQEENQEVHTPSTPEKRDSAIVASLKNLHANTLGQDLHAQSMHESHRAMEIWDAATEYDTDTEHLFNIIQVFTACLNSFAHGANDVSNAIAPISAILWIYKNGDVPSKSAVPKWLLAMGGAGIVVGLALYGYRVMKSVGYKLTKLSPSRGASAELAASLTVVTASFLEIPVSSTQCIVGAVSGVGLVNGPKNVQWLFLLRVMFGWVVNFFCSCLISAGIFSFAYFSPSTNN